VRAYNQRATGHSIGGQVSHSDWKGVRQGNAQASIPRDLSGYVCGCVLRVAREVLALLPIDWVLVTASAETLDSRTGHTGEAPVLSAAMSRAVIAGLDFDRLNPSDAMENFLHRGDFKASRESDEFESITPLTPDDLPLKSTDTMELSDLVAKAVSLREALCLKIAELNPNLIATAQEEGATQ